MVTCYLGIGSNLGNRQKNIKSALQKIRRLKDTEIIRISKIIETKPVDGPPDQGKYLNACLKIKTKLSPSNLLKRLKSIERELGRKNEPIRYAPRTMDIDILFYGDKIINRKDLKIPHPRVFEREFVIRPLLEII